MKTKNVHSYSSVQKESSDHNFIQDNNNRNGDYTNKII